MNWDLLIIADCSPLIPHYSAADEAGFIVLRIMALVSECVLKVKDSTPGSRDFRDVINSLQRAYIKLDCFKNIKGTKTLISV